ncbi:hypothetical protein [Mycobacterium leprae]
MACGTPTDVVAHIRGRVDEIPDTVCVTARTNWVENTSVIIDELRG